MLEQSLVVAKSGGHRYLSLPVSIALHAGVIAAAVAAAVWNVELPQQPPNQISTYSLSSIPAAPAPPPARRGDSGGRDQARVTPPPADSVAPRVIPADIPDVGTQPVDPPAHDPGAGTGAGDPDGTDDGVPGGVGAGGGTGDLVQGGGGNGQILRPGGNVTVPVNLVRVDPAYPQPAVAAKLEGTVILECIIGRDGSVREPRVVRSAHPILDRAAVDSVRRWRFRPATLNGEPVDVYFHLTVRFALSR
jgi:protein TonB